MGVAAQFEAGGDEDAVDLEAGGTGEFEAHLYRVRTGQAAREHPAAAGEHGAGQEAQEALWVVRTGGGQPKVPLYIICLEHTNMIGLKGQNLHRYSADSLVWISNRLC